jgi:hypothetical protein
MPTGYTTAAHILQTLQGTANRKRLRLLEEQFEEQDCRHVIEFWSCQLRKSKRGSLAGKLRTSWLLTPEDWDEMGTDDMCYELALAVDIFTGRKLQAKLVNWLNNKRQQQQTMSWPPARGFTVPQIKASLQRACVQYPSEALLDRQAVTSLQKQLLRCYSNHEPP